MTVAAEQPGDAGRAGVRVAQLVRQQQLEELQRERIEQELRVAQLVQQTPAAQGDSKPGRLSDRPLHQPAPRGWRRLLRFYRAAGSAMGLIHRRCDRQGCAGRAGDGNHPSLLRAPPAGSNRPAWCLRASTKWLCDEIHRICL